MEKWLQFFRSLNEDQLYAVALLRVIECTNGCIQHSFRGNDPKALTVEQTRKAMKYSMAAMKNLKFSLGGLTYIFPERVSKGLREARELYIKAFKQGDESAREEFFDCSIACAQTLGKSRITKASQAVKEYLNDVFPEHTVDWGERYLLRLLKG